MKPTLDQQVFAGGGKEKIITFNFMVLFGAVFFFFLPLIFISRSCLFMLLISMEEKRL